MLSLSHKSKYVHYTRFTLVRVYLLATILVYMYDLCDNKGDAFLQCVSLCWDAFFYRREGEVYLNTDRK